MLLQRQLSFENMPRSTNPDWIDWRTSKAREIILNDLKTGVLEDDVTAEDAWNLIYVHLPEIVTVCFSQFEVRLKSHRKQVAKSKRATTKQKEAMEHDRQLHPIATQCMRRAQVSFIYCSSIIKR